MRSPEVIDFAVTRVFHAPWTTVEAGTSLESRVNGLASALAALGNLADDLDLRVTGLVTALAALAVAVAQLAALSGDPTVLDRLLVDSSGDVISDAIGNVLWI